MPLFLQLVLLRLGVITVRFIFFHFAQGGGVEFRSVPVPSHRFTPLKENWMKIFTPIVDHLKLQIRLNTKTKNVEIKVS